MNGKDSIPGTERRLRLDPVADLGFEFRTDPEICPYLHDRPYALEILPPRDIDPDEHDRLLSQGIRRFGAVLFAPACGACRECVPIRVPVAVFAPSRSQRRVLRKNSDIDLEVGLPTVSNERLRLYDRFHAQRHRTRGWPASRMRPLEYFSSFVDNLLPTHEFRYRLGGRLVGLAYVGESRRALNSIYAFFDPDLEKRSLGTLDILREIEVARDLGKEFLYLGFLVAGCSSMEYKAWFRPHEVLRDGRWVREGIP